MANRIYRGPVTRQPVTISDRVTAGAYLPGVFGTENGATFTIATAATGGDRLFILANRDFYSQDTETAYASGDTAVLYRLEPGQEYQAGMVNADYDYGDPLTLGANGRLTAATTGDIVVAHFDQADTTIANAGDLADVVIANFVTLQ